MARAGASTGRRRTSCPATAASTTRAHRAARRRGVGRAAGDLPPPGPSACELLDAWAAGGCAALLVMGSNLLVVRARRQPRRERGSRRSTSWWSRDSFLSETARCRRRRAARGAVGGGRRHDDQPRGPPAAAAPGRRCRRRGCGPISRCCRASPTGSAAATASRRLRRAPSSRSSRRAMPAGGKADYAGITWDRIAAERRVLALPHAGAPGHAAPASWTASPPLMAAPASTRSSSLPPAEQPDAEYPLLPHYRTRAVAVPVRHADAARAVAGEARPGALRRDPSRAARGIGIADGEAASPLTTARRGLFKARLARTIRLDTLFVPFHYAGPGRANLLTHRRWTRCRGCPNSKACAVRVEPHLRQPQGGRQA